MVTLLNLNKLARAHARRHALLGEDPITWPLDPRTIGIGTVSPIKLQAINTPVGGYLPAYDAATGKFVWTPYAVVTKHTELTDKEVEGVIDHADFSVTMAKLEQEVQNLIINAFPKTGGEITGDVTLFATYPMLTLFDLTTMDYLVITVGAGEAHFDTTAERHRFYVPVNLTASEPASPAEGDVMYDSAEKRIKVYVP